MNDFTILQEEILQYGWLAVWQDIEGIENPTMRAIERLDFFEVMKTLPIEWEKINIIDVVLEAQKMARVDK